jgi:hypothetical protein
MLSNLRLEDKESIDKLRYKKRNILFYTVNKRVQLYMYILTFFCLFVYLILHFTLYVPALLVEEDFRCPSEHYFRHEQAPE